MKYSNPVIKGFNPDPSICRVGSDYYLVTSTFEFFPGVPIYHSTNLVNWELIGHCLTHKSHLNLDKCRNSGGIYAPTIRHHEGRFYMTTTNVSHRGNFIVWTDDIRGEWSDPIWIDQGGIDPSLLFDDGRVYYCSTGSDKAGKHAIQMCEIDIETGEKLTPSRLISYGSGGRYCEAPHLYRLKGWYYLIMAEGGTEFGHMSTLQRSRDPYGPFEDCPHNPVLSHRDEGSSPVQATGHSDLLQDHRGNWWLVSLAIRQVEYAPLHILGRETFLTPVTWNDGEWFEAGTGGMTALVLEADLPDAPCPGDDGFRDDFDNQAISLDWTYIRNPVPAHYVPSDKGILLKGTGEGLSDFAPTFMGIRQAEFAMTAQTSFAMVESDEMGSAGITAYYNRDYYYSLGLYKEGGRSFVRLVKTVHSHESEAARIPVGETDQIDFMIKTSSRAYEFFYKTDGEWLLAGIGAAAGLATEGTMSTTFTGTFIGIFAVDARARFHEFSLQAKS